MCMCLEFVKKKRKTKIQKNKTKPNIRQKDWTCIPGILTPIRAYNNDIECMSGDNTGCIWATDMYNCYYKIWQYGHTKDSTCFVKLFFFEPKKKTPIKNN